MRLRIIAIAIIIICAHQAIASAANNTSVLHIGQGDLVYYGDTVDLRGITGWTENLSWWKTYDDPQADPPDHIITIEKFETYKITATLEPGMWYQWYGKNERQPVPVFYVMPGPRPITIAPTPTPTPGVLAPVVVRAQPAPIADLLIARWDDATYDLANPSQVWLLGPSLDILGNQSDGDLILMNVSLAAGNYDMLIQYPDANGVYEIYHDGDNIINSTEKDVPGFWYAPMSASVLKAKLMSMFNDTTHFHGRVVEKQIIIQEQRIDATNLDETPEGSIVVSGITNLAKGDTVIAIFDEDKNVIASDLTKMTFYGNITGDDIGAYRLWQAALKVNLQTQAIGNHFISLYTPDGTKTMVPFYLAEAFKPFNPPEAHLKYINNSPFIPVPTPQIITQKIEIPVTVIQTIVVPVTPPYETVLQAQQEAAQTQRHALETNLLMAGLIILLAVIGYKGGKYVVDVVKRARLE